MLYAMSWDLVDANRSMISFQEQVGDLLRGVHIAPHVPRILALWGVVIRLRRPNPEHYSEKIASVLRRWTGSWGTSLGRGTANCIPPIAWWRPWSF